MQQYAEISIDQAKKLILIYQKTRDPEVFAQLLYKFDRYLIYLVRLFQKRFDYLRNEDSQNLYQDAIIGMHNGILALPERWTSDKILLWIGSYVKNNFRNKYLSYNKNELRLEEANDSSINYSDSESTDYPNKREQIYHQYNVAKTKYKQNLKILEIQIILNIPNLLTEKERQYIDLTYFKGLGGPEVGKIMGCDRSWVSYELRRILKKIKTYIEENRT